MFFPSMVPLLGLEEILFWVFLSSCGVTKIRSTSVFLSQLLVMAVSQIVTLLNFLNKPSLYAYQTALLPVDY